MRMDAAPLGAFSSDLHWIGSRSETMPRKAVSGPRCHRQDGEAELVEVCRPSGLITRLSPVVRPAG
jgi:hypothetical protein